MAAAAGSGTTAVVRFITGEQLARFQTPQGYVDIDGIHFGVTCVGRCRIGRLVDPILDLDTKKNSFIPR